MLSLALMFLTSIAPHQPAIDTLAARQLVEAWKAETKELGCLFGHHEQGYTVIDSVQLAAACGAPAIGMVGFIRAEPDDENSVIAAMTRVLKQRTEFEIAGEVYAIIERASYGDGTWGPVPRVWWAQRNER